MGSGKSALEPAQRCKHTQQWGQAGGGWKKNKRYSDASYAYFTYQNKFHNFSILGCATGFQVIPDWQTWLNSNFQIWNPERKPSHFIRQWCTITEIPNIRANSSIFNTQFCTKSNALLSNAKSTLLYSDSNNKTWGTWKINLSLQAENGILPLAGNDILFF